MVDRFSNAEKRRTLAWKSIITNPFDVASGGPSGGTQPFAVSNRQVFFGAFKSSGWLSARGTGARVPEPGGLGIILWPQEGFFVIELSKLSIEVEAELLQSIVLLSMRDDLA